jgi:hypothetical protein
MNRYLILLLFVLFGCNQNETGVPLTVDSVNTRPPETAFSVQDTSMYAVDFLAKFAAMHQGTKVGFKTVLIRGDSIIINGDRAGFIKIPTDLPLNTALFYHADEKKTKYRLMVRRINFTTLVYEYSETGTPKSVDQISGIAGLPPTFYYGAEGTFNDGNGSTVGMIRYGGESKDCEIEIFAGLGSIKKMVFKHRCKTDTAWQYSPLLSLKNRTE